MYCLCFHRIINHICPSLQNELHKESLHEPGLVGDGVLAGVDGDGLQRLLYHRLHVAAVHLAT